MLSNTSLVQQGTEIAFFGMTVVFFFLARVVAGAARGFLGGGAGGTISKDLMWFLKEPNELW